MLVKKIICTALVIAGYLLFTGFTQACDQQLTLDVISSQEEYERDTDYCATNFPSSGLCRQETNVSFNFNIDKNLADHQQCCCESHAFCC